jgi:hypothetical protein
MNTVFIKELLVIGIVTAITGFIISTLMMYASDKNFSMKEYHFWKQVFIAYFITGILLHLGFEYSGLNKYYCKYGNACLA